MTDDVKKKTWHPPLTKRKAKALIHDLNDIKNAQKKKLSTQFGKHSLNKISGECLPVIVPLTYFSQGTMFPETVQMFAADDTDKEALVQKINKVLKKHMPDCELISFDVILPTDEKIALSTFKQAAANSNAPTAPEAAVEATEDSVSTLKSLWVEKKITSEEAEALYREILKEEPENVKAHVGLADVISSGLSSQFRHHPTHSDALKMDAVKEAFQLLTAAQDLDPSNPEVDLALGQLYVRTNNNEKAGQMATLALQKSGGDDVMRNACLRLLQSLNLFQTREQLQEEARLSNAGGMPALLYTRN
ncbi:MAG: tetratricopeptide repeat protein [Alphaproteobacteria bacterium]